MFNTEAHDSPEGIIRYSHFNGNIGIEEIVNIEGGGIPTFLKIYHLVRIIGNWRYTVET